MFGLDFGPPTVRGCNCCSFKCIFVIITRGSTKGSGLATLNTALSAESEIAGIHWTRASFIVSKD